MGIVDSCGVYRTRSPNVQTRVLHYTENGQTLLRTIVTTPLGELTSVSRRFDAEKTESTSWQLETPFKGPVGIEISEGEVIDGPAGRILQEHKQQPESVSVGSDGLLADIALIDKILTEESLNELSKLLLWVHIIEWSVDIGIALPRRRKDRARR